MLNGGPQTGRERVLKTVRSDDALVDRTVAGKPATIRTVGGRVSDIATPSGRTPDRLAVDVGATEFTGVSGEAYARLKADLGVEGGHTRVADPITGTVRLERVFREKLGVDAVGLFVEPRRWRAGRLRDGSDCLLPERWRTDLTPEGAEVFRHPVSEQSFRRERGERVFRAATAPLADCESAGDVARKLQSVAFFDWPHHADEIASEFGVRAEAARRETESACVLNVRARLVGGALDLRGERLLADLEETPALVEAILERLSDTYIARLTDILPEVAPHADVVCVVEGPGSGIPVEAYRRFFRPHHERIFTHIKKTSGLPLVVMVKGMNSSLVREIAEACGADAVGVGCGPGTATAAELRAALGREIVLWGVGCGASMLETASPGEVRAEVARSVEAAGGPERLVFAFGEPIPPGTKLDNLLAALEEARSIRP